MNTQFTLMVLIWTVSPACLSPKNFFKKFGKELNNQRITKVLKTVHDSPIEVGRHATIYRIPWCLNDSCSEKTYIAVKTEKQKESRIYIKSEAEKWEKLSGRSLMGLPHYYGCVKNKSGKTFIFMEKLDVSFNQIIPSTNNSQEWKLKNFYKSFWLATPLNRIAAYRDMARGLASLHTLNLVHNNIKPEHIMFNRTAKKAKLIAFGEATLFGEASETAELPYTDKCQFLTMAGESSNTQGQVDEEEVDDWKRDIWALGITIFELEMSADNNNNFFDWKTFLKDIIVKAKKNDKVNQGYAKVVQAIYDTNWISKRGLNLCASNDVKDCFDYVLRMMLKPDRSERSISAWAVAKLFDQIIAAEKKAVNKPSAKNKGMYIVAVSRRTSARKYKKILV